MPRRQGLRLKTRRPRTPTTAPEPLTVTGTDHGITLSWADAAAGDTLSGWQLEFALSDTGPWFAVPGTIAAGTRTTTYTGSAYGQDIWFRVGAVQSNGNVTPYTDAVETSKTGSTIDLGSDDFTGTSGDALASRGNWDLHGQSSGSFLLSAAGRVYSATAEGQRAYVYNTTGTPAVTGYSATCDIVKLSDNNKSQGGPAINLTAGGLNFYAAVSNQWNNDRWQLIRSKAGVATQVGSLSTTNVPLTGQSRTVTIARSGDTIQLIESGVVRCTYTDPDPLTDPGYPGIVSYDINGVSAGFHFDNFGAEVTGGTGDITPPDQPTLSASVTSGAVALTVGHDNGDASAEIWRSRTSGGPYTFLKTITLAASTSTATTDPNISFDSQPYYYTAIVLDGAGNRSVASTQQSVTPTPEQSPNVTALTGSIVLSPTFNCIGVEATFSGDDNINVAPLIEYSTDGSTWTPGLMNGEGWATYHSVMGRVIIASVAGLTPNTLYYVRVTVDDPDGELGSATVQDTVTTRAENITQYYDTGTWQITAGTRSAATHWVDPVAGDDGNAGTSEGAAWQTMDHAWVNAPAACLCIVKPGINSWTQTTARSVSGDFIAEYAAADDAKTLVNTSNWSIIQTPVTVAKNTAAWTSTPTTGPVLGGTNTVWKATNPLGGFSGIHAFCWDTHTECSYRLPMWDRSGQNGSNPDSWTMTTVAGWAEVLYNNSIWGYGAAQFSNADVYVRLPPNADASPKDPNDYDWWFSDTSSVRPARMIQFNGPDIRLSGFNIHGLNIRLTHLADRAVISHNALFHVRTLGYWNTSTKTDYVTGMVFERNVCETRGFWSTDPDWPSMPWGLIKWQVFPYVGGVPVGGGVNWDDVAKEEEADGTLIVGNGGFQRMVFRHNLIRGYFNGVAQTNNSYSWREMSDLDSHDNTFEEIGDDCFEPEGASSNWRIWNNTADGMVSFLSCGPHVIGPMYLWRNVAVNYGSSGLTADNQGLKAATGKIFKLSKYHDLSAASRIFVANCTFWTADPSGVDGADGTAGSVGPSPRPFGHPFWIRNTIWRSTRYIINGASVASGMRAWNEDYNAFATSDSGTRGINGERTIANYRTVSPGNGQHTNTLFDLTDEAALDAHLANPASGNVALVSGSGLRNAGVVVTGVSDTYTGSAPSIGAIESGEA